MNELPRAGEQAATLTVDLDALVANWQTLRERAGPAECAAVVKADAYGTGAPRAGAALAKAGCRSFFVAHLSEARRLRPAVADAAIYVLNGFPAGSAPAYREIDARPVLGSAEEVAEWRAAGGGPSALHIDTGMNRLGLDRAGLAALLDGGGLETLGLTLLMSHFVSAEEPEDPINLRQIADFTEARAALPDVPASLCNCSALFLADAPVFDLCRPGYALYGGNPTPGFDNPMRPVVSLAASILQVRTIREGDTVGYNAQWTAARESRIATVSLGYADGWLRSLSCTDTHPGGVAVVGGVVCPMAGRVSMDLITLDVTGVPAADAQRGAPAWFLGEGIGVDDVAKHAGTNGYEILTSLGRRYHRVYRGG